MRIRLEAASQEEIVTLFAEQLEATLLEHEKNNREVLAQSQSFDELEPRPKYAPLFYVEGVHLTMDVTSGRHAPGEKPKFLVKISKSY